MYAASSYTRLTLYNEKPIFVSASDNKTIGLNNTCVKDISVGYDGSIWAITCGASNEVDF